MHIVRTLVKRWSGRLAMAAAVVAAPVALMLGTSAAANAGTTPTLTLSNGSYSAWVASGSGYTAGLSDVQIWVQDVTDGGWSTLEYQSSITTSSYYFHCYTGSLPLCVFNPGGLLSAKGALGYYSGLFSGYYAIHPLLCGHQYQAVTYDPNDGWVYSNVLTEPACPVIQ